MRNAQGNRVWAAVVIAAISMGAAATVAFAQTFKSLVSFDGTNGAEPAYMALVQGMDGNLYGTTIYGGANTSSMCANGSSCGTVFSVTPGGALTTLYSFCSQPNCSDGANPAAVLTLGRDGSLYGSTEGAGQIRAHAR